MNKPNALVIDDHENVLNEIRARLDSKGHSYVTAKSQDEAERIIDSGPNPFDYILLDVQIPCAFQGPARLQFGKNLLVKIRQKAGFEKTPIIVITAYGNDSPHLAVELLKLGADDFINKPFEDQKVSLEEKIDEVLRESARREHRENAALANFSGGKLVFYPDRVDLCVDKREILVCGDRSVATIRTILDFLRQKRESKDKRPYTGKDIGKALHLPREDTHVREAVRDFRQLCTKRLFEAGFECTHQDIIRNSKRGYEFGERIEVCAGSDEPTGIAVELSERQKAIAAMLNRHSRLTRKKLADKLALPVEAFKDDLTRLVDQNLVSCEGNGSSAVYFINNASQPVVAE
jgi:DNA-binding response OmpR family regulator